LPQGGYEGFVSEDTPGLVRFPRLSDHTKVIDRKSAK
jgi:hypothetical protein